MVLSMVLRDTRPVTVRADWLSRLLSSLGLALVLVSQLCSLVHMGAIRHERCAEHGELVELSEPARGPTHRDLARLGDDVVALSASGVATDEHDHCQIALNPASAHAPSPSVVETLAFATPIDDASHMNAPDVVLVDDALLVAPKTSPPSTT
jgi:hypothetical protein